MSDNKTFQNINSNDNCKDATVSFSSNDYINCINNKNLTKKKFDFVSQMIPDQKSFEKKENKNNYDYTYNSPNEITFDLNKKLNDLEYFELINKENSCIYKKEDLEEKINQIKIYLKTQFEKGSEKMDYENINNRKDIDSIHTNDNNNNEKSNLSIKSNGNELNQSKKENNFSYIRSKSNCEGIFKDIFIN